MSEPDPNTEEQKKILAEKLRSHYEAAGLPLPEGIALTPRLIWTGLPIDELAARIADYLGGRHILFRRGDEIGTIEPGDGTWRTMEAARFRSWLVDAAGIIPFKGFKKPKDGEGDSGVPSPIKSELKGDQAQTILKSDVLRLKLPEIERINHVRLPVYRDEVDLRADPDRAAARKGFRKIDLLPIGYDIDSKTFTLSARDPFDHNMEPDEAVLFLRSLLKNFPWGDDGRSEAVQIAAMLTVFCDAMIDGRPPLFVWNSNLAGSGKSRLAELVLSFIHPSPGKSGYHHTEPQEVRKELDSAAQNLAPYHWFDDVKPGLIANNDLNRWLTAEVWKGRKMSTHEAFSVPLLCTTLLTGTGIELDDHLSRRTLVVDLFSHQAAVDRVLPTDTIVLNARFFKSEEMAGKVIASLYALVRNWDDQDRPRGTRPRLDSFEEWSDIVPGICTAATYKDPLEPFLAPDAGNTDRRDFEELVSVIVREVAIAHELTSVEVSSAQIVGIARRNSLFLDVLGSLDHVLAALKADKGFDGWDMGDSALEHLPNDDEKEIEIAATYTDKRTQSKWGKKFRSAAMAGQWFTVDGEVWQFGDRSRRATGGVSFNVYRVEARLPQ